MRKTFAALGAAALVLAPTVALAEPVTIGGQTVSEADCHVTVASVSVDPHSGQFSATAGNAYCDLSDVYDFINRLIGQGTL